MRLARETDGQRSILAVDHLGGNDVRIPMRFNHGIAFASYVSSMKRILSQLIVKLKRHGTSSSVEYGGSPP